MNRHVIAHCNHLPGSIEHSAGVIPPFFNVWGKRGAAKRGTHFFRDRAIQVGENFYFDGIAHGQEVYANSSPCAAYPLYPTMLLTLQVIHHNIWD
jgi:hypothetical protein